MLGQSSRFFQDYFSGEFAGIKKSSSMSSKIRQEGNLLYSKKHHENSHMEVLSLYSKSIAFAPKNSEELALGFGNRSALLIHVKKYEECIIDIERALSITKSKELKAKLSTRKALCLKSLNESKSNFQKTALIDSKKLKLPQIKLSKKVSCVVESVKLKYDEKYGKHMVANQDIRPGEVIAVEKAFLSFPLKTKQYVVCSHCLSQSWNANPCNFCTENIYCSEKCKSQAWEEYHDIECYIITNVPIPDLNYGQSVDTELRYRAALRFFTKIVKNYSLEYIIQEIRDSGKEIE